MAEPALSDYRAKRNFAGTPEPAGTTAETVGEGDRWVIQQHAARRMHYDFRLEAGGVLISWAVPKGPSYDPAVKRLAVKVEDHPLDYREFEGIIPQGNYGAGSVIVWDEGTYRNLTERRSKALTVTEAVEAGHVSVWLEGHKLVGGWSLTRFGTGSTSWALVKRNDEHADAGRDVTRDEPLSVKTGRTVEQVSRDPDAERWLSNRNEQAIDAQGAATAGSDKNAGRGGAPSSRSSGPSSVGHGAGGPAPSDAGGTSARPDVNPAGAEPSAPAAFVEPMLAQADPPGSSPASGPLTARSGEWLFEPKLDGLRCIAVRNGRDVSLFSRNRLSFNARFPTIVNALKSVPASNFVFDGELVGMVDRRPDFGALQHGDAPFVEYWVFDLPWLLGRDLRHLPIEERRSLLAKAIPDGDTIRLMPGLQGDPRQLFESACQQGWEGLVAKRSGSTYREGRSPDWRKLKCACRQELVIGGFTEPRGTRDGFGALLLGYWEHGALAYAGKVGTGFTRVTIRALMTQLAPLGRPTSPFAEGVVERGAQWVEPDLVAEVTFSNWTPDGRLRHPSFVGMRPDKGSHDVVREECEPRPARR